MHRDARVGRVDRGQEGDDFDVTALPDGVKRPGAVLSGTPGDPSFGPAQAVHLQFSCRSSLRATIHFHPGPPPSPVRAKGTTRYPFSKGERVRGEGVTRLAAGLKP